MQHTENINEYIQNKRMKIHKNIEGIQTQPIKLL